MAKPKIDKALIEQWIAALRSGGYAQGKGALRRGNKFCCLGVLCDLVDPTKWEVYDDMNIDAPTYKWADASMFPRVHWLPPEIDVALGKPSMMKMPTGNLRLSDANDTGTPFTEIADGIEAHYKQIGAIT